MSFCDAIALAAIDELEVDAGVVASVLVPMWS